MTQCRISVMHQTDDVIAAEIGIQTPDVISSNKEFVAELQGFFQNQLGQHLKEEQQSRSNGWQLTLSPAGSELMCKKVSPKVLLQVLINITILRFIVKR